MIKNPYFNTNESGQQQEEKIPMQEYPAQEAQGFTIEIEKGFTSIIIPAFFNSYPVFHTTGNCIGSIREHTDMKKTPYEIILVINGNTGIGWLDSEKQTWNNDNTSEAHTDKIIANSENLGYAKAVNQGIRCAKGEFISIINNDVQVFNYWLEDMQECLNIEGGPSLIEAYPMYGMPWGRAVEAEKLRNDWKDKGVSESLDDFRDFSCILTKKILFRNIGLFDEQFFCYGEDLDLIRRIEKAGGSVKSTKRVRTHHIISMTASGIEQTPEIMNKSAKLLHDKWGY